MKQHIPVYDICNIDKTVNPNILVESLNEYLSKHYSNLHRPHRHSFYHFVLFTSGKGSHTIDFESFKVSRYQMYFMSPGQVHSWHFDGDIEGYIVHFGEELFTSFLQRQDYIQQFPFFSGSAKEGVLTIPLDARDRVEELFKQLLSEVKQNGHPLDMIRVLLLELFVLVERHSAKREKRDIAHSSLVLTNQFKQLVEKQFRTLKLPKEYAQLLYITPNHLNAVTRDVLGMSAGDVIRHRVILEAKRLLTNAELHASEIAYDLNFQDNSYFTRYFKKYVGMTPDQFRKTIDR